MSEESIVNGSPVRGDIKRRYFGEMGVLKLDQLSVGDETAILASTGLPDRVTLPPEILAVADNKEEYRKPIGFVVLDKCPLGCDQGKVYGYDLGDLAVFECEGCEEYIWMGR